MRRAVVGGAGGGGGEGCSGAADERGGAAAGAGGAVDAVRVAGNRTGYFGVHLDQSSQSKQAHLGMFATVKEAALGVARTPEGQAATKRFAAAAQLLTSEGEEDGASGNE